MGFFSIPGNIKQQFIPFVLNPKARINLFANASYELNSAANGSMGPGVPQVFTYKYRKNNDLAGGRAKLRFYPSSMDKISFNDDISLRLLYPTVSNKHIRTSVTIKEILNAIPGIQIREYIPDTRLDQCMNIIHDFFQSIGAMLKPKDAKTPDSGDSSKPNKSSESSNSSQQGGDFMTRLKNVAAWTMEYMTGTREKNFYYDIDAIPSIMFSSYKKDMYAMPTFTWGSSGRSQGYYVMTFPYMMYYTLQSCVTTNIYEVPAIDSAKRILDNGQNGESGWNSGSDLLTSNTFRLGKLLGGEGGGIVSTVVNALFGNIGINYTPWWDAATGTGTQEPALELTFDLFNDSFDAALANFIFVNTIIPNNRWIQYNMFQHSPSIYDVKIEGLNRLYACKGTFSVTYDGVLRNPPMAFINTLVQKHANVNMSSQFKTNIVKNKLIKIPDVYHVKLHFESLLPQNFNNYIYTYAENKDHVLKYKDHAYDASGLASSLTDTAGTIGKIGKALGKFGKRAAAAWKDGGTTFEAAAAAADNALDSASQQTGGNVSNVSYDNDQGDIQD